MTNSSVPGDSSLPGAGDDFFVSVARLRSLSSAFAGQQGVPAELAGGLDGAATVDSGDPAADSAIREGVGQFTSLLRQLGEAFSQNAEGLTYVAGNYQTADQAVGDGFAAIIEQPGGARADQLSAAEGPASSDAGNLGSAP